MRSIINLWNIWYSLKLSMTFFSCFIFVCLLLFCLVLSWSYCHWIKTLSHAKSWNVENMHFVIAFDVLFVLWQKFFICKMINLFFKDLYSSMFVILLFWHGLLPFCFIYTIAVVATVAISTSTTRLYMNLHNYNQPPSLLLSPWALVDILSNLLYLFL